MEMIDMATRLVAGVAFPAFVAIYLMVKMESTLSKLTAALQGMAEMCRECRRVNP